MKRRIPHLTLIALSVAALLAPAARAGEASVKNLQAISADFALHPCVADSLEKDTRVAVNPTEHDNIVVSWNQDGVLSTVVAVSEDGGETGPGGTSCQDTSAATGRNGPTTRRWPSLATGRSTQAR